MRNHDIHLITERNPYIIPSLPDDDAPITFGNRPPAKESYEEICGPQVTCPECTDIK